MGNVRRIYVEKKAPFAVKAKELKGDLKNYLNHSVIYYGNNRFMMIKSIIIRNGLMQLMEDRFVLVQRLLEMIKIHFWMKEFNLRIV